MLSTTTKGDGAPEYDLVSIMLTKSFFIIVNSDTTYSKSVLTDKSHRRNGRGGDATQRLASFKSGISHID